MGYNRRNTTLILIITIVSVLGLSIAFAAFSSSLTVKSNATITPDSGNFKVVFSSSSTSLSTTNVSVSKTGNATAGTPTIDNSGNPTIKNLSASFTAPGEKVEYTFYARNEGSYDAYLSSVVFDNIKNKSVFKECVAGDGATSSLVSAACSGIKVTATVLSTSYTDTTLNITNHVLKKNNSELVKVTIEYASGSAVADGPFTINFGNIYLTYGSTSLSGMPTLPVEPICTAVTTATTGNVPSGNFAAGDEYTCDVGDSYTNTFFVLENSSDTVSLIMKENFTDSYIPTTVSWCTDGGEDNTTCKNISTTGSEAPDGADYLGHIKSIFNKDEVEVNFPSADQIATASGKTFNNSSISGLPTWIYDYLYKTIHPGSGSLLSGYWTTTSSADSSDKAWYVNYDGRLSNDSVYDGNFYGLRPVITISKSLIK